MSAFYDLNKTPRNILNQAIVRAIVSENNGAWFDPSDLSTLYQDAAGTIPVTEVGQPVGKMLDKSGNGYHATQSITASRPTLSARYNLLTKTEDITSSDWATMGTVTREKNYSIAPDGTLTSQRLVFSATSNANQFFLQQVVTAAANYTGSVFIRATSGSGKIKFGVYDGQIKTNTYDLTEQWQLITYSNLISAQLSRLCWLYPEGAGFATDIQIWHPSAILGTTPGTYQRVNTSTDYDTDERYFKKYLRFDGVDDYLNLPYMGLYAGGACSIVAAMGENKVAYGTTLINETNSTLTAPMYNPTRQSDIGNNWRSLIRNDANVVTLSSTGALINADGHISVRSRIERESNTAAFENSINKESYNYARAGTLTLDKTTIGSLLLGGVMGSPNNMNLYGLIITKSALTDSQRVACERHQGRKAGVPL